MALIAGGGPDGGGAIFREPIPFPGPIGGGGYRYPVPTGPGIHWFGPGGSGVAYPGFGGQPIHFPIRPIFPGGPFHGIPNPGIHPMGPGLAHLAARRAGRRAIALRRALY